MVEDEQRPSSDFIANGTRRVVAEGERELPRAKGRSTGGVEVGDTDETPDEISKTTKGERP